MNPDKTAVSVANFTAYFGYGKNIGAFFKAINSGEKLEVIEKTNYGDFKVILVSTKLSEDDLNPIKPDKDLAIKGIMG